MKAMQHGCIAWRHSVRLRSTCAPDFYLPSKSTGEEVTFSNVRCLQRCHSEHSVGEPASLLQNPPFQPRMEGASCSDKDDGKCRRRSIQRSGPSGIGLTYHISGKGETSYGVDGKVSPSTSLGSTFYHSKIDSLWGDSIDYFRGRSRTLYCGCRLFSCQSRRKQVQHLKGHAGSVLFGRRC